MVRSLAMVCLLILPGATTLRSELVTIDLIMIDYRFIPDRLIFVHDVHYQLHLENHGRETHELTAPTFFATADIDNPNALNHYRTEIVVQPGGEVLSLDDQRARMISARQNGREWLRTSVDAVQRYVGSRWRNGHRGWGAENAVHDPRRPDASASFFRRGA
jgi:hypothetical protein